MNGRMLGGKPIYVALAQRKEVRMAPVRRMALTRTLRQVRRAQLEAQHAQRQNNMRMQQGNQAAVAGIYPGGAPMFYQQQRQGFVYPQQMGLPRPRWAPPAGGARPGYPQPYGVMPQQGQQMQNGNQQMQGNQQMGRGRGGRGGRQQVPGRQQPNGQMNQQQGRRGFKFAPTARNREQAQGQQGAPNGQQVPMAAQQPILVGARPCVLCMWYCC